MAAMALKYTENSEPPKRLQNSYIEYLTQLMHRRLFEPARLLGVGLRPFSLLARRP